MEFIAFVLAVLGAYGLYRVDRLEKHLLSKGIIDQRFRDEKPWDTK